MIRIQRYPQLGYGFAGIASKRRARVRRGSVNREVMGPRAPAPDVLISIVICECCVAALGPAARNTRLVFGLADEDLRLRETVVLEHPAFARRAIFALAGRIGENRVDNIRAFLKESVKTQTAEAYHALRR